MSRTLQQVVAIGAAAGTFAATGSLQAATLAYTATSAGLSIAFRPNLPKPPLAETAIKQPIPPRQRAYGRRKLPPVYALYETAPDGTSVDCYAFHDGRADAIEGHYLNDDIVSLTGATVNAGTDGRYGEGAVSIYTALGEPTNTAFSAVIALLPDEWTEDHRGDGVVTGALTKKPVKGTRYLGVYPNGDGTVLHLVGRWMCCFDWRDPAQDIEDESTWQWTENSVLHLAHFMMTAERLNEPVPLPIDVWWSRRILPRLAYWTAAADDCEVPVPLKAGGTEPRYRGCVTYLATDDHRSVKAELLATFDGWLATAGDGSYVVYSGRYYEPTVTLGASEITSYSFRFGRPDTEAIDGLTVSYISADHAFAVVDTDPWQVREGNRTQPFAPQVPSHGQARRLAKRDATRRETPQRFTITTNAAGRAARLHRFLNVNLVDGDGTAFYQGPVEVLKLARNLDTGGMTMECVPADPSVGEWDAELEEGEAAPAPDRVPVDALTAPTIVTAEAVFDSESADGLSGARIAIIGTGPDREDLGWFTRWRLDGTDDPWVEESAEDTDPASPVALMTGFVPVGVDVEVQIAYEVGDGRRSPWSS